MELLELPDIDAELVFMTRSECSLKSKQFCLRVFQMCQRGLCRCVHGAANLYYCQHLRDMSAAMKDDEDVVMQALACNNSHAESPLCFASKRLRAKKSSILPIVQRDAKRHLHG